MRLPGSARQGFLLVWYWALLLFTIGLLCSAFFYINYLLLLSYKYQTKRVPTLLLCFSPAAAFPQEIDPARHTIHACAHRHTSIASPTTATNRRAAPPHLACITAGSSSLASCSDPILMVTGVIRDTHLSRQKRAATRSKRLKSSSRNLQSVC